MSLTRFQHGVARQADGGGELLHGLARVALQLGEEGDVASVQNVHRIPWTSTDRRFF